MQQDWMVARVYYCIHIHHFKFIQTALQSKWRELYACGWEGLENNLPPNPSPPTGLFPCVSARGDLNLGRPRLHHLIPHSPGNRLPPWETWRGEGVDLGGLLTNPPRPSGCVGSVTKLHSTLFILVEQVCFDFWFNLQVMLDGFNLVLAYALCWGEVGFKLFWMWCS